LSSRGKLDEALKCLENILEPNDITRDLSDRIKKSLGIQVAPPSGSEKKTGREVKDRTTVERTTLEQTGQRKTFKSPFPPKPLQQNQLPNIPPDNTNQPPPKRELGIITPNQGGGIVTPSTGGGIVTPNPMHQGIINPQSIQVGGFQQKSQTQPKVEDVPPTPPPKGLIVPKSKRMTKKEKKNLENI